MFFVFEISLLDGKFICPLYLPTDASSLQERMFILDNNNSIYRKKEVAKINTAFRSPVFRFWNGRRSVKRNRTCTERKGGERKRQRRTMISKLEQLDVEKENKKK